VTAAQHVHLLDQVDAAVRDLPGASATEISKHLGVRAGDHWSVYRALCALWLDGVLEREVVTVQESPFVGEFAWRHASAAPPP
jgi:hypothetical protein